MKVKSFYSCEPVIGQVFEIPSRTEPDLALSIPQLLAQYSVGQLPTLAELQKYLDIDIQNPDIPLNDEEMDDANDFKFSDRVDMLERFMEANHLRKSIFNKLKAQHDFKKEREAKFTGQNHDNNSDLNKFE